MKNHYFCISAAGLAISLFWSNAAWAQGGPPGGQQSPQGWSVSAGGGLLLAPNYLGDDAYQLSAVPSIRITYGETFEASVEGGIKYRLIDQDGFRAGPLARLDFGRDEDGDGPFRIAGDKTQDLIGLGDIDETVSFGGFIEYGLGPIELSAQAGQAISGHDGLTGEIAARYKGVRRWNGPPLIYSFGPSVSFGDGTYMDAFFGITPEQSVASGLDTFDASGGITAYGFSGTAILPLTNSMSATFLASYNRLAEDAAGSPLVLERGSKDQFFFGAITSYRF